MFRSLFGSIAYFLFFATYTPIYSIAVAIASPFISLKARWTMCAYWLISITHALKWCCGVKWVVEGAEHLSSTEGAIVLAKHQSAWETLAIPAILFPHRLCFVYKKELHYIPFFGWSLALLNMVPIDRSKGLEAFEQIKTVGSARMKDGAWMIFFPEGTRVPVGEKKRYKTGGTRLAIATNTPVIPMAHNAGEFWPKNSFLKKPGTITVRVGPPIRPEGHTPDSLMNLAEQWIENEMHSISPHRYKQASATQAAPATVNTTTSAGPSTNTQAGKA